MNWAENTPKPCALSGKIMLRPLIVLLHLVIFMVLLHMYARWYLLRIRRRCLNSRRSRCYVDSNSSTSVRTRGLDASVLNSLQVFIYSSRTHPDGIDCAACLSEFEENEKGRILPKCRHRFHTDCIDVVPNTLHVPNLPSPVEAQVPVQPPQNSRPELMVSIDEGLDAEPADSSSTVSLTSMADRRKGLDLVGGENRGSKKE